MKEAAPGFDVEVPLLAALCRWRPAAIVELVATDAPRGWVLTRDAGRMLHDVMFDDPETGRAQLRAILMAYARLQVDCQRRDAPPFAHMLEDRSPAAMARSFAAIVGDDALLRDGGATSDDLAQRGRWLRFVNELCRDLAALDLPLTLEHGDLHTSNIMIAADGGARIADWGDACWATPLHGLVMCLDDVAGRHKIAHDDPWFAQLAEEYFDIWRRGATCGELHRALEIVRALAPVSGVLQWSRGTDHMPADARTIMAGHIVKHLRALG
jgi:Phosphotransferase enzyme family